MMLALLVFCSACLPSAPALVSLEVERKSVDVDVRVQPLAGPPVSYQKRLTVDNTANVEVVYSTSLRHLLARCFNTSAGVSLFLVESGDANTNDGTGPFCDTCTFGPALPPVGKAFLRTSAGTATVACDFVETWPGGASLGGGGGISLGLADDRYLNTAGDTATGQQSSSFASTAANPAWSVEAGEGIYDCGADCLGFASGGTARASFSGATFAFGTFGTQMTGSTSSCATPSYAFGGATNYGLNVTGAGAAQLCVGGSAVLGASATAVTSTMPHLAPTGAVGAVSYGFSADTNNDTGMWRSAENTLAFSTAGVLAAGVTSSQNTFFTGILGGTLLTNAPVVADAVSGYNMMSSNAGIPASGDCDAAGEGGRYKLDSTVGNGINVCTGANGWAVVGAQRVSADNGTSNRSPALVQGGTFLLVSGTAYFVYLGQTQQPILAATDTRCRFHVTTAGAGAQTAEIGLFSSTTAPARAGLSLTKLVASGSVDALTSTGIKGNASSFATAIAAGTHLWCGIRTAMATTQPTIVGVSGDQSDGYIQTTGASGVLTGAGPFAGAVPALATVGTNVGPELRVYH